MEFVANSMAILDAIVVICYGIAVFNNMLNAEQDRFLVEAITIMSVCVTIAMVLAQMPMFLFFMMGTALWVRTLYINNSNPKQKAKRSSKYLFQDVDRNHVFDDGDDNRTSIKRRYPDRLPPEVDAALDQALKDAKRDTRHFRNHR